MKNKPLTNPFKPIVKIITKFNMTLFILVIAGGLIVSVLALSNILAHQPTSDSSSTPSSTSATTFDQTTIDRLNKLTTSDESSNNQVLPSTRNDPFSE